MGNAGSFRAGVDVAFRLGKAWAVASGVVNDALDSVCNAAEAVMDYLHTAALSFGVGVDVGFKVGKAWAVVCVVNDALDSVCNAAEAVIDYLRTAASWAWDKLKAAAAFVKEKVLKLLRRLRGRKEAAAARSEMESAAAADAWMVASQQATFRQVVLSRASARVAGFVRLQDGGAALDDLPASGRAAQLASEMMAHLETDVAALGDTIPKAARSCIAAVVAAVGIGLEAIAALDA